MAFQIQDCIEAGSYIGMTGELLEVERIDTSYVMHIVQRFSQGSLRSRNRRSSDLEVYRRLDLFLSIGENQFREISRMVDQREIIEEEFFIFKLDSFKGGVGRSEYECDEEALSYDLNEIEVRNRCQGALD